jgi:hypothetical protein
MTFSNITKIAFVFFFVMSLSHIVTVYAQDAKGKPAAAVAGQPKADAAPQETVKVVAKEASGVISSLSSNFIAVVTGVDSLTQAGTESAFNLDKNVRIIHKKSLKDIKVGDTVTVSYEETLKLQDGKRKSRSTSVKSIAFLKAAPKEPVLEEPAPQIKQPQVDSAASEETEPQSGSLPLKGLRGR